MTLDEWLTLSDKTNGEAAEMANAEALRRGIDPAPPINEHRVSRLRLKRREPSEDEVMIFGTISGGKVEPADWLKPAPETHGLRGSFRNMVRGVWVIHKDGVPLLHTADLSERAAWEKAGFRDGIPTARQQVKAGMRCEMVSKVKRSQAVKQQREPAHADS